MNARAPIIDPSFVPSNEAELLAALGSWEWRIFSGQLYKIMVKEDEDAEGDGAGHVRPFIPNDAQRAFMSGLHYRNIILKARQLGFTTLIAILWLDHALFNADQRCCIIAHTEKDAKRILRDKVRFAYDRLPDWLRDSMPLEREAAEEMLFAHNNSAVEVTVSARSGTYHRLHVSEMGKVAAKHPQKAVEIVTGSLPSVPKHGVAVIESTAEGQEGEFYDMATRAEELHQKGRTPTPAEWAFHFFPWWRAAEYTVDPEGVIITPADHEYFAKVEAETGTKLTMGQRAWYVQRRENDFSGDAELMWREMPSTSAECWQRSTEGTFYAAQLARARVEGRITKISHVEQTVVHTFWDIGSGDGTAVWAMQHVGTQHRFLRYFEDWSQGYAHYVQMLRATGWLFGVHHLPHDADHERQMEHRVGKPIDMLREIAPDWKFTIVPRVNELQHGIDLTRAKFPEAYFDEEGCKEGLEHLALYRKKWNARLGVWGTDPEKLTGHSEAADALRQWAQGYNPNIMTGPTRPRRRNRPAGGMWI